MGPPDPTAEYEEVEVRDADWLREHFRVDDAGDGLVIKGVCRRCGHEVDLHVAAERVLAFRKDGLQDARPMRCNCGGEHAGRDERTGCGAWWGLRVKQKPQKQD